MVLDEVAPHRVLPDGRSCELIRKGMVDHSVPIIRKAVLHSIVLDVGFACTLHMRACAISWSGVVWLMRKYDGAAEAERGAREKERERKRSRQASNITSSDDFLTLRCSVKRVLSLHADMAPRCGSGSLFDERARGGGPPEDYVSRGLCELRQDYACNTE